jgi:hypothetical protein
VTGSYLSALSAYQVGILAGRRCCWFASTCQQLMASLPVHEHPTHLGVVCKSRVLDYVALNSFEQLKRIQSCSVLCNPVSNVGETSIDHWNLEVNWACMKTGALSAHYMSIT